MSRRDDIDTHDIGFDRSDFDGVLLAFVAGLLFDMACCTRRASSATYSYPSFVIQIALTPQSIAHPLRMPPT
jgi:hypothetical protein